MDKLTTYAKEFVSIGLFHQKKNGSRKGYILIEKKELEGLLDKYMYDTAANKLKIWKALRWIDTESDGRVTKRVYDGESGKYKPYVKMNVAVLEQLQKLLNG